jgi:hypothetical protein
MDNFHQSRDSSVSNERNESCHKVDVAIVFRWLHSGRIMFRWPRRLIVWLLSLIAVLFRSTRGRCVFVSGQYRVWCAELIRPFASQFFPRRAPRSSRCRTEVSRSRVPSAVQILPLRCRVASSPRRSQLCGVITKTRIDCI